MKLGSTALFDDSLNGAAAPLAPLRDVEFLEMPVTD